MTTPFNPVQASEDPLPLKSSPDVSPPKEKVITKKVPNQSWAMVQSMNFIQLQSNNLRDPYELSKAIADSMTVAVDAGASNSNVLSVLNTASDTRRTDLELDPIDSSVYKQQRDPRLLVDLVVQLLNDSGLETELGTDLTFQDRTLSTVEVADPNVRPAWQAGSSPGEETAIAIAEKLGLEVKHSSDELINLSIPIQMSVDSTDPYIKKARGQ